VAEAKVVAREAAQALDQAAQDPSGEPLPRQEQAFNRRRLGDLLGGLGRPGDAEQQYRDALRLYSALAAGAPQNAVYRRDQASSTWGLVNLLILQGKLPEAEKVCCEGMDACEAANRELPQNTDIRMEQAEGHRWLGAVLGRLGRADEAEHE